MSERNFFLADLRSVKVSIYDKNKAVNRSPNMTVDEFMEDVYNGFKKEYLSNISKSKKYKEGSDERSYYENNITYLVSYWKIILNTYYALGGTKSFPFEGIQ